MKKVIVEVSLHGDKSRPNKAIYILIEVMKILIPCNLPWNQQKSSEAKNRIKAMQIVAGTTGIVSLSIDGKEKNQIVVLGDDFDPVKLTNLLRRNVGHAIILSVDSSYKEKKETTTVNKNVATAVPVIPQPHVYGGMPGFQVVEVIGNPGCNCSIM
ncbi:hypothetical protein ACH5RR_028341 [Cinchona calisaya]|uniref:HMA domain-containing protein n=1 Tax=Cinchona calisaya TaxID=153742 RepID=A0ABD2YNH7_9GENT